MTNDKEVKQILRSVQNNDVLKVVSDATWKFSAPKPIATGLQTLAEADALIKKAGTSFVTGFGTGALTSKSVRGGIIAGAANALTKSGRYILEHREDAYNRIKKASATGDVTLTLPMSDIARSVREGKLIETAYEVAKGTINTYSPQDNIEFVKGGIFWKR